jgi:preprotein translocase subunit Sss1
VGEERHVAETYREKTKKTLIAAHKPSSDEYLSCAEIEIHFFLIGQKNGFTDTEH